MSKLVNIIRRHWIGLTLLILSVITFLSLWPLGALPPVPGTDKTHHFIAYAFLMLPTALRKPAHWIVYGFFFIAYSGGIELVQPFVNRYGEWLDLLANFTGLVCGVIIAELITFITSAKSES